MGLQRDGHQAATVLSGIIPEGDQRDLAAMTVAKADAHGERGLQLASGPDDAASPLAGRRVAAIPMPLAEAAAPVPGSRIGAGTMKRCELTHRIARDDEGLALVEFAHDRAVSLRKLLLRDLNRIKAGTVSWVGAAGVPGHQHRPGDRFGVLVTGDRPVAAHRRRLGHRHRSYNDIVTVGCNPSR